jgi:hypothetical protein
VTICRSNANKFLQNLVMERINTTASSGMDTTIASKLEDVS